MKKILKTIGKVLLKILAALVGLIVAYFAVSCSRATPIDEKIKDEAEKAKDKKYDEVKATPAADVGDKYLSSESNRAIGDVKQSAVDKLTARSGNS